MKPANIIRIIALCLLVQVFMSNQLWMPIFRGVPNIPAFDVPILHFIAVNIIFILPLLVLGLLLLVIIPQKKWLNALVILTLILYCLQDILCLQPWVYLYGLFLVINLLARGNEERIKLFKLLLVGLYIWSGIQKLNISFTNDIMRFMMEPFGVEQWANYYEIAGWLFASMEILAGIGLLFSKAQRKSMWVLIGMHLLILLAIGPLGQDWNEIVWPWNMAQIILLWMLFSKADNTYVAPQTRYKIIKGVVVTLVFIMPVFNLFGYWDHYLSGSLYSGNTPIGYFHYSKEDYGRMSWYFMQEEERNINVAMIDLWVIKRTNASMYPQERYYKYVAKCMCDKLNDPDNAGLDIIVKDKFTSKETMKRYTCKELTGN